MSRDAGFILFSESIIQACLARDPDFVIGRPEDPYLKRWHILHTRDDRLFVHQFLCSDDDRALHDHPWEWNQSVLLRGRYREWRSNEIGPEMFDARWHRKHVEDGLIYRDWEEGSIINRTGATPHRIELIDGPVWTMFSAGPKVREWGFHCPNGWVPWQEFVQPTDKGQIGKGCGE